MRARRIGLAQINTTVGDIGGNVAAIRAAIAEARAQHCDIVGFPELAVTGYPAEDLLLKRSFCQASREAITGLAADTRGIIAIVGFVDWRDGDVYNSAAILVDGQWADTYDKRRLPNYGVFDEERYFSPGKRVPVYRCGDVRFGVSICEDIWYPGLPLDAMALGGAEICINLSSSPYHRGRIGDRVRMLATRAADNIIAVAYTNQVGGQDELVFDGGSMVFDARGELLARARQFEEELLVFDIDFDSVAERRLHDPRRRVELRDRDPAPEVERVDLPAFGAAHRPAAGKALAPQLAPLITGAEEVWRALVLATGDYIRKTGFTLAHIGLSGGIDSSVVAAIAADALGGENVIGVSMPSRYSSEHSKYDARKLSERLGTRFLAIPIEPAHDAMLGMLADAFEGTEPGTAEENLQARQRGNVLMTLSNKAGSIVLTTGNKSEMATGYATLYGDMAGGYAPLKDVPKTVVYEIARWRNQQPGGPVIPEQVLTKPPSAELRPGQLDQDSLPPYEELDQILEAYVEDDETIEEIVARGFDAATVVRVVGLVDRSEYKRRQAAPGVKITPRAFGRDRRYPLASRWQG